MESGEWFMSIAPCTCETTSLVKIKGQKLSADHYHIDDDDGVWCCVYNEIAEEYHKILLIAESVAFAAVREAEHAEAEAHIAEKEAHSTWRDTKEYPLVSSNSFSTTSTSFVRKGGVLPFDPSKTPAGFVIKFAAVLEATEGDVHAVLYNISDDVEVAGSELKSGSGVPECKSITLSLSTSFPKELKLYEARFKATTGTATVKRACIDVVSAEK